MAELKKHGDYRMSLLAYSFLEEYEARVNFFMNRNNVFPMDKLTGDSGKKRAESSSRKLAGWCKGLVEPYKAFVWERGPSSPTPCIAAWEYWSMELDFAHRSVSDFLETDEVQRDMQLNLRHFDHVDAVIHLVLSDLLYENATSIHNISRSGFTTAILLKIIEHYDLAREPYTYLERVRELLAAGKPKTLMPANIQFFMSMSVEDGFNYANVAESVGDTPDTVETIDETCTNSGETAKTRYHFISDPLQSLTLLGRCNYALWHINNSSGISETPETLSVLACICLNEWFRPDTHAPLAVLEALFERGWLSPNTITTCRPLKHTGFWREDSESSSGLTLWHYFLVSMLENAYSPRRNAISWVDEDKSKRRVNFNGKLFQLFLRFKADVEFNFSICVNEETTASRRVFLLNLGSQGLVLKLTTLGSDEASHFDGDEWRRPSEESEIGLPSKDGTPARRDFSLREFLEFSSLDNKDKILKILDEQSKLSLDVPPSNLTTTTSITRKEGYVCGQLVLEDDEDRERNADRDFN